MEYRYLGRSGLMVSALSLGGWVTYGTDHIHPSIHLSMLVYRSFLHKFIY